ncbi:hypothetical protein [uncultured Ramlibacter sp.]|uniref:hypothetical protein n=1 Tax=uncultured Ramlibacter sp. TaxID=260755 RepID=UPI002621EE96|nr:hypothetical protein [uncultured Ramlibacter sp.]
MNRVYTRSARAFANGLLVLLLFAVVWIARNESALGTVLVLVLASPGIICYGHFLSSQLCGRCRESIFDLSSDGPFWRLTALATPFQIPMRCPHCQAATKW